MHVEKEILKNRRRGCGKSVQARAAPLVVVLVLLRDVSAGRFQAKRGKGFFFGEFSLSMPWVYT